MTMLPHVPHRVGSRSAVRPSSDRQSLACVLGVSAVGLAASLVAAFGPAGSDLVVALAVVSVGAVGLGIGLAAALAK